MVKLFLESLLQYRDKPVRIHLSHKLLTGQPRREIVESLLHEMIHAWDFIVNNTCCKYFSLCSQQYSTFYYKMEI